jgi:hypothetical protein
VSLFGCVANGRRTVRFRRCPRILPRRSVASFLSVVEGERVDLLASLTKQLVPERQVPLEDGAGPGLVVVGAPSLHRFGGGAQHVEISEDYCDLVSQFGDPEGADENDLLSQPAEALMGLHPGLLGAGTALARAEGVRRQIAKLVELREVLGVDLPSLLHGQALPIEGLLLLPSLLLVSGLVPLAFA